MIKEVDTNKQIDELIDLVEELSDTLEEVVGKMKPEASPKKAKYSKRGKDE